MNSRNVSLILNSYKWGFEKLLFPPTEVFSTITLK